MDRRELENRFVDLILQTPRALSQKEIETAFVQAMNRAGFALMGVQEAREIIRQNDLFWAAWLRRKLASSEIWRQGIIFRKLVIDESPCKTSLANCNSPAPIGYPSPNK